MAPSGKGRPQKQVPRYMEIAADIRLKIKTGEWPPKHPVPSAAALCEQYGVSMSVTKKALDLLKSERRVYGVFGVGTYVADRPSRVRIANERQLRSPEITFGDESNQNIEVVREAQRVQPTGEIAEILSVPQNEEILHTVTRTTEGGQPISISDTYQPLDVEDISSADTLVEALAVPLPAEMHAAWLGTPSGDRVVTIKQKFVTADDRVIMVSNVSYPLDRYDEFVFRMTLPTNA